MKIIEGPRLGISGKIDQWEVVNSDGSIERSCYTPKSNLITDAGLDLFCTSQTKDGIFSWNVWNYFAIGTSLTCPNISNPAISILDEEYGASRSTYTYATWDTSYVSPTGGEDGHYYFTQTRGIQLPAGSLNGTYTELGFSPTSTKNSPLFSKFRFVDEEGTPVSVPVSSDQILRLRYVITVEITPIIPYTGTTTITGPMIGGDHTYTAFWCEFSDVHIDPFSLVVSLFTYGQYAWTPGGCLDTSTVVWQPIGSHYPYGTSIGCSYTVGADYIAGSHYIYKDFVFPENYGSWAEGFSSFLIVFRNTYGNKSILWTANFDTPIIKLNTHNLSFRIKFSWGRV
jgi:hypothetical protein